MNSKRLKFFLLKKGVDPYDVVEQVKYYRRADGFVRGLQWKQRR